MSDDIKQYVAERNKALTEMDMTWLREHLSMIVNSSPDEVVLAAAHKCRYEVTGIAPELRHESKRWLVEHGYNRLFPSDFLPDGELPE